MSKILLLDTILNLIGCCKGISLQPSHIREIYKVTRSTNVLNAGGSGYFFTSGLIQIITNAIIPANIRVNTRYSNMLLNAYAFQSTLFTYNSYLYIQFNRDKYIFESFKNYDKSIECHCTECSEYTFSLGIKFLLIYSKLLF